MKSEQLEDHEIRFKNHEQLFGTIQSANELVFVNVHQTMRDVDSHEGINWLQTEHAMVKNIFNKATNSESASNQQQYTDYESTSSRKSQQDSSDPVKKKLERFLMGSKNK